MEQFNTNSEKKEDNDLQTPSIVTQSVKQFTLSGVLGTNNENILFIDCCNIF
jgi:hypothetical protein